MGRRKIPVARVTAPRLTKNFRAEGFGDFIRAVRNLVVNGENNFARPALNAFQRAANAVRLIAGNDAN